jgi:hypothetical protein
MRIFIPILLLVLFGYSAFSYDRTDSLITVLKKELAQKKLYDSQKEARIKKIKSKLLAVPQTDLNTQYALCGRLYEEYKVYQYDSAYVYTQKLLAIGRQAHDAVKQNDSRLKISFLLLSSGMFNETFDCLKQINTHLLGDSSKIEYYAIKSRAYSDLAEYNNDTYYAPFDKAQAIKYIDSAIALTKPNTFERLYQMGNKQVIMGELLQPSPYYIDLLDHYPLTEHHRAMVATGLAYFYEGLNHERTHMNLLAIGAINDIRSSTKETLAIFELGEQVYNEGDIDDAYLFMNQAMDDAQYYGARLRKLKIGAVLPVLQSRINSETQNEKNRFLVYLLSITVVAVLVALISFIVFIQLKRLKVKEKIIEEKNGELEKINDKLIEDTHIKEEYIGYFFNVISGYILKLEKLKRNVERKVSIKKYEDVTLAMNEINIKKERETLFYTFDHVFLKIFPNFIHTFNSLLKKEDQIWPKDNEVLNTDLRIFALMRLGINDNETIANILEYSVNTIYVYKMRIKAKALVPSDQFEHRIMDIKAVEVLNKS